MYINIHISYIYIVPVGIGHPAIQLYKNPNKIYENKLQAADDTNSILISIHSNCSNAAFDMQLIPIYSLYIGIHIKMLLIQLFFWTYMLMTAQCWWYMLYKGTVAYIAFKKGIVPDRSYHPIFVLGGRGKNIMNIKQRFQQRLGTYYSQYYTHAIGTFTPAFRCRDASEQEKKNSKKGG